MRHKSCSLLALGLLLISPLAFGQSPASELEARERIAGSIREAFDKEDFAKIEVAASNYRTTRSRTASGLWKLTLLYIGVYRAIDESVKESEREKAFRRLDAKVTKWEGQFPQSPTPQIARSILLNAHAWAYRGDSFAYKVPAENWAPFHKYISMARQSLEGHKAIAAVDPTWYVQMLGVARAEGWDRSEFDALLNEALEREPAFYETYFTALEYLLPKWHGGTREIELFAREAVKRTFAQEGWGMYARIYWAASETQFRNALFKDSSAQWPNMKKGFEDVIARYPDVWNLNNYAKFACLARDKPKTRELLNRIQSNFVTQIWEPPALRQWCIDTSRDDTSEVFAQIKAKGARATIQSLHGTPAWLDVLAGIGLGDADWLQVAAELSEGAEAESASELQDAFAWALVNSPELVLAISLENKLYQDVCNGPPINFPNADAEAYFDSAIRAMRRIEDPVLQPAKEACIGRLWAASKVRSQGNPMRREPMPMPKEPLLMNKPNQADE